MSMTGWPMNIGVAAIPCEEPTVDEFRARFPEFNDLSDERIEIAIDEASCWVDSSWIASNCQDCTKAMAYLAAHYLMLGLAAASMVPDTFTSEDGTVVVPGGQVTSLSFESMSVGFSAPKVGGGSGGANVGTIGDEYGWGATPYGQRFQELLKVNKPAILVV